MNPLLASSQVKSLPAVIAVLGILLSTAAVISYRAEQRGHRQAIIEQQARKQQQDLLNSFRFGHAQ